jgi:hypothetical protein
MDWIRKLGRVAMIAALALCLAAMACADEQLSGVTGKVTVNGGVHGDVLVTGFGDSDRTDSEGNYRLDAPANATDTVVAEYQGHTASSGPHTVPPGPVPLIVNLDIAFATPTPEPSITPTPLPTATPTPGPTNTPTPTPAPSPTPAPTATPSPQPTATPSPQPTATPSPQPTATPAPTAARKPPEPGVPMTIPNPYDWRLLPTESPSPSPGPAAEEINQSNETIEYALNNTELSVAAGPGSPSLAPATEQTEIDFERLAWAAILLIAIAGGGCYALILHDLRKK